jgi:hypothetical protein
VFNQNKEDIWSSFVFKVQASVMEVTTLVFFLPVFAILPYEEANQLYSGALVALKEASEITALVLAAPIALSVALFSIPLQMFQGLLFSTGVVAETVWYLGESWITGTDINELVPHNN